MKSYRFTNQQNVMSDWGHAMFADDRSMVEHYGEKEYTVDHQDLVAFEAIREEMKAQLQDDIESGAAYDFFSDVELAYGVDAIVDSYNPDDIVDGAEAYDNSSFLGWLCERFLTEDIRGIKTRNGAVVFDEEIISKI